MKNRGVKLVILAGVLALLLGGFLLISHRNASKNADDVIAAIDGNSISTLSWTADGKTLTLQNTDKGWVYLADSAFPVDQSVPQAMVSALAKITANDSFSNSEDLSSYGLKDPVLSVTVTLKDKTTDTLAFGEQNAMTKDYYLLWNGDAGKVWTVDATLHDAFAHTLFDMVQKEALPDFGEVTGFTITQDQSTLAMQWEDDGDKYCYTDEYHWFLQKDDGLTPLDTGNVKNLYSKVTGLTWISCVNYKANADEMVSYGLSGADTLRVTLTYTPNESSSGDSSSNSSSDGQAAKTFTLLIGSQTDGGCYASLDGSSMVYLIDSSTAQALQDASWDSLRSKYICLMNWNTVSSMDITLNSSVHSIVFEGAAAAGSSDSSQSSNTQAENIYTCNGTKLNSDAVESVLSAIKTLSSDAETSQAPQGQAVISFTFHRNTSNLNLMTLTLYPFNGKEYQVSFNGETRYLIPQDSVEDLLNLTKELFPD